MIKPRLQEDEFLKDVEAARQEREHLHLWWLGQSGFLLQWQGKHVLLDPYLSDSLTVKYAATDKPHVRLTERVVAPERLNFIDVVTSSHNHTDHLDADTLAPLRRVNPELRMLVPLANRDFVAKRLSMDPQALATVDAGQRVELAGFEFSGIPAAHEALERDALGRFIYLGYVVRLGPWIVYHSGDTIPYEGMVDLLRPWHIDVALLPINGRAPERRVAGNLWGREAARLAKGIGARLVIPCHYDMFAFNTATPEEFVNTARELGQPQRVLEAGERWHSGELPAR